MKNRPPSARLAQLEKVMRMRVKKMHALYLEKLDLWREARRKVEEQRQELAELDSDLQSVVKYMTRTDVMRDPSKLQLAVSRRHWTVYDKEKVQYYLEVAQDDLREAGDVLDLQKKIWLKSIARENMLKEQYQKSLRTEQREQEQRDEMEVEDSYHPASSQSAVKQPNSSNKGRGSSTNERTP